MSHLSARPFGQVRENSSEVMETIRVIMVTSIIERGIIIWTVEENMEDEVEEMENGEIADEDENSDGYPVFRNESLIPLLSILG